MMLNLIQTIKQVARVGAKLLLTGENGTGKEVMAQLFHYHSTRSKHPMMAINCGAIPPDLVESELFGHEKGAFTGAYEQKKGCFEIADGSTLFLDEIGEMPMSMQIKMLRAIEIGSFRRIGGKEEVHVDINLISATNKILIDQVKTGSFREDLFYRINVIELYLPPLRHRKGDIPLLVNYYKDHFAKLYGKEEIEFCDECMDLFVENNWPGNVRELKNVVERSVILADKHKITVESLPDWFHKTKKIYPVSNVTANNNYIQVPIGTSLDEIERMVIDKTLLTVDNNKTKAAKILGLTRKTLHNKLDKYGKDLLISA